MWAGVAAAALTVVSASPGLVLNLRYATPDNFTHERLYDVPACKLQTGTARRLERAAADLLSQGYKLEVWDCYRPLAVQKKMWALVPDTRYVANPTTGSRHNRGASVDVTLSGQDLGSQFDEFGPRSHRNAAGLSDAAKRHREVLSRAMQRQGFVPLATEWWHFDDPHWAQYPLLDEPLAAPAPAR